jgi:hypothetical protein
MSQAIAHSGLASHPIGLIVSDDLRRSRLTVFFRLLLAIPHFVFVSLWSFVACLAVIVAWFAALVTGRVPDGLHNFLAAFLRYSTRVTATSSCSPTRTRPSRAAAPTRWTSASTRRSSRAG